jgi:hypothetical protein
LHFRHKQRCQVRRGITKNFGNHDGDNSEGSDRGTGAPLTNAAVTHQDPVVIVTNWSKIRDMFSIRRGTTACPFTATVTAKHNAP